MAHKLKTFDFDQPSTLTMTEKATYPWEQWFDGDIWELTHEEDFHTHPLMMERIVRTRATNRGAKIRLRHVALNGDPWGVIVLQRTDITGPDEAKRLQKKERTAATRAANSAKSAPAKKAVNGAPSKRPPNKLIHARKISKRPAAVAS